MAAVFHRNRKLLTRRGIQMGCNMVAPFLPKKNVTQLRLSRSRFTKRKYNCTSKFRFYTQPVYTNALS